MTEQEARNRIRTVIEVAGGPFKFAALYGFTDEYVTDMVHDEQEPRDRLLAKGGSERIGTEQIEYWEK